MNRTMLAHLAAAAASMSAGMAVVATRFVIGETDPVSLVFYRYLVSVLCFAPFLRSLWPRGGLIAADYARIAALGIVFFVFFPWAFNASLEINPAARGAVGLATIPIQTLLVAAAFGRERLSIGKLAGVVLTFGGIAVAFGADAFRHVEAGYLRGDGLMLLGVFFAAVYSVFSRPVLMRHGPLFVTALGMAFAVAALFPVVTVMNGGFVLPSFNIDGWLALMFLGTIAGALQFSLFMWALRWLPSTTTVLYLTLNPIAAMVLGVILLGETLTPEMVAGVALVLAGIAYGSGILSLRRKTSVHG